MRNAVIFFLIAVMFTAWVAGNIGCANIVPPQGGPRDSIPPVLLKSEPADSTVNFREREIVLNFNEFIELKDVQNNLIFSPTFQNNPGVTSHGKTITIKFRDSLEKNTTYVLNFGNAITDISESNVLKDFVYTFSTGPALDSLTLDGRVILAETGEIDSTLIAVLHRDLTDSAVNRSRPLYAVRLDRNGRFHFKNLPADTFALYVIGDAGLSKKYMNNNQLFAFPDKPVIAGKTDSLLLYAYREEEKKSTPPPSATFKPGGNDRRLRFATAPPTQQDLLENYELNFSVPLKTIDTSKIQLTTDSIFAPVRYNLSLDSTRKKIELRSQWKENTRYNLVLDKDFATDTTGRQLLKSDTVFFTTKKAAEYGNLVLKVRNIDSTVNPVLLFIQNGKVVKSVSIRSGSFQQALFPPGEYSLRVLYDRNNNGKWDPGQFFKGRRQPEIVNTISQTIVVKPNWENEFDVVL